MTAAALESIVPEAPRLGLTFPADPYASTSWSGTPAGLHRRPACVRGGGVGNRSAPSARLTQDGSRDIRPGPASPVVSRVAQRAARGIDTRPRGAESRSARNVPRTPSATRTAQLRRDRAVGNRLLAAPGRDGGDARGHDRASGTSAWVRGLPRSVAARSRGAARRASTGVCQRGRLLRNECLGC
jgi:hypothetical protein